MTHCQVIAEIGVNHNGRRDLAMDLIRVAGQAGCDAVKFQTFRAERLVTADAPKAHYQTVTTGVADTQFEMLRELELSEEDHRILRSFCDAQGIEFLSTPFDEASAVFLVGLGVRRIKVSSGDLTNLPFLAHLNRLGLPVILSTGMGTLAEVEAAVAVLSDVDLTLMHCVTSYPAPDEACNLAAMETMRRHFDRPVGWSDHTVGSHVAIAAAALGAAMIEKHITLDRALTGPDHAASLEPDALAAMVHDIRAVEAALGDGTKRPQPCELENMGVARRSITAIRPIAPGEALSLDNLGMRRPGTGLGGAAFVSVLGRRASRPIPAGTVIDASMLTESP